MVKSVRTGQPVPGTVRVVFDLDAPVVGLKPRMETTGGATRLVLEWPGDGKGVAATEGAGPRRRQPPRSSIPSAPSRPSPNRTPQETAARSAEATSRLVATLPNAQGVSNKPVSTLPSAASTNASTYSPPTTIATGVPTTIATGVPTPIASTTPPPGATKSMQQLRKAGMRELVIAIDAGHGGQDPGALGRTGTREKDVTLAIARELARQINATPGLKAYLTRDTDVFIPLAQRYQKARAAKADMFVSIHADAFEQPPMPTARRCSCCRQRGASSQAARWLAEPGKRGRPGRRRAPAGQGQHAGLGAARSVAERDDEGVRGHRRPRARAA